MNLLNAKTQFLIDNLIALYITRNSIIDLKE